ncbi:MAG: hypothetical protein ACOYOA_02965 [Saprospiraceae bacterium]
MSNTHSLKLFQLIHSLSSQEKRFISLKYAKIQEDESKYYLLFNTIVQMQELDEQELQKRIYGDEKVKGAKFSELKNYCYNMIISTLQEYDKEGFVDFKLRRLVMNIRSLYKRALYDDCRRLIKKIRKIAEDYEQLDILLDLLRWEKQIAYALGDINFLNDKLNELEEVELSLLEKIRNVHYYKNMFYRVHTTIRKYRLLDNTEIKAILEDVSHSRMFESQERALTFSAKVIYLRTLSLLSYVEKDNELFYQNSKELIALMQSRPWILKEDISEFISANSNFVIACMSTHRSKETLQALENFNSIQPKTSDDKLKIHRQYYQGIFEYYHNTGEFELGYKALQKHLVEKKQYDKEAFNSQGFYYAYFYMAFGSGHFKEALGYLNDWLNSAHTVDRQDLQALAQLLNLIIHFELKNKVLMASLLRSASRYLKKRKKVSVFEKEILKFIGKATTTSDKKVLGKLGKKICQTLETVVREPEHSNFTQYFDFISWIESQTSERNFAEIVQQRFIENQNKR